MADSDKLSGAELGSTNHGSEHILRREGSRWRPQSQVRKLPFQKLLDSLSNENGNVNENATNNRFDYRIQSLHVGMQTPGHFSAVVFRNRT